MAKNDPETGAQTRATDGDPDPELQKEMDELARARAKAKAEAQENGNGASSIDDQKPPIDEADDGQMFVWEQGQKVTLGTLIKRGVTVEHAFVFGGKRLKGRGGLIGHDEDVFVVVRGVVGKTSIMPTRDDQERVTKVTVETHIASKVVLPADSDEGIALIQSVLDARGLKAA